MERLERMGEVEGGITSREGGRSWVGERLEMCEVLGMEEIKDEWRV